MEYANANVYVLFLLAIQPKGEKQRERIKEENNL